MRSFGLVTLAVLSPLLVACGGGDEPDEPSETVTVFSDPSEAATPDEDTDASTTVEPNVGDRALQVGQQRVGRSVTTTLLQVRDPYPSPDPEFPLTREGNKFIGLRLSQCVVEDETDDVPSTYNGEWVAVTANGDEYPGDGSSFNGFPSPKFPEFATIAAGSCVRGWISLEVPESVAPAKFVWRSEGQTLAEWLLK